MGSVALKRFTFVKNAFILTATGLLLRTIGMFFRVYVSNQLGSEGMGLYQLIFSVYILATTLATSGITVAVTRLVVEEMGRGTPKTIVRLLKKIMLFCTLLGLLAGCLLFFGADPVCRYWIKDMRGVMALKVLAPSLPFMSISNCLRGYFMARRRVAVSSSAQIFEQLVRIAIVMGLLGMFASKGLVYACTAVMIGNTVSEMLSCLYMYIGYRRDQRNIPDPTHPPLPRYSILGKMLSISAPIAAGGCLNSLLRTIENLLVPDRLTQYTSSRETSLSQFGMLKGMAMPVLFFPASFLSALSTLLVPEISEAHSLKQNDRLERMVNRSLHISFTIAIFIGGVFTIFSGQLGQLLYQSDEVGFYIFILAPLVPFMYVESIVDGILKGLNQQVSSLKYNIIDSLSRIALIFFLVPVQGMKGFLFIMVLSNLLTSFLNMRRLITVTGIRLKWGTLLIKPIGSVVVASIVSLLFLRILPSEGNLWMLVSMGVGMIVAFAIYFVMLSLTGSMPEFRKKSAKMKS